MSSSYSPSSFLSFFESLLQTINPPFWQLLLGYIAIAPIFGIIDVLMSFIADKYGSQRFLFRFAI